MPNYDKLDDASKARNVNSSDRAAPDSLNKAFSSLKEENPASDILSKGTDAATQAGSELVSDSLNDEKPVLKFPSEGVFELTETSRRVATKYLEDENELPTEESAEEAVQSSTRIAANHLEDRKLVPELPTEESDEAVQTGARIVASYVEHERPDRYITENITEFKQLSGQSITNHRNIKKNGEALIYDSEGKLTHKVTYKNNELHGQVTTHFPEGNVEMTIVYKDNVLDGPFISYYRNGLKQCEGNYVKGKREGIFTYYDSFGDISRTMTYKNGLEDGPSITFFPKHQGGKICQKSEYEEGFLVQSEEMFYDTGELLHETIYKRGIVQTRPVILDKKGKPISSAANKNEG
jgi:antitoxin component YwqK of YwqJK toxin-antitoxin module